ncbi:type VI secretion system-associated FHA domain protein TagH [Pseudomonas sp. R5(2019)]|uniref:type VI secretion system-associated FHA domain protein TagH n=1 Tax=Pseudomonas sp. R5(2019) TaxID=2697566 RepID=UPI001411D6A5|nr:type VI secretion system-associated FHA domain protein TagH [Pseudomonas sp. R5(2019)]NBA94149.1 type VI secretion system-associated FHA domain protein TagH [Pseudomonas sp. R5(2019)]
MNTVISVHRLALVVENPQALQKGSAPRHTFDAAGGTIGARGADWILHDHKGYIQPIHCEIRHEDGHFIILDRSGKTRVNGQADPLGASTSVRLSGADTLHIGPYRICVSSDDEQHPLPDSTRHLSQHEVGELLGATIGDLDSLPHGLIDEIPAFSPQDAVAADFLALSEPLPLQGHLDPLQALDEAERAHTVSAEIGSPLDANHYGLAPLAAQADLSTTRFEAFSGSPLLASGDPRMSEQDPRLGTTNKWLHDQYTSGGDPAGWVAPLVEGLGAPVGALAPQAAHALLFEAGRTLGALIRGLTALHEAPPGHQQRMTLAGRTLQPIEDNPLRLGQSYPDTVHALFSSTRSVVHLSPTAAVEESLEQIRQQQSAMLKATAAGLNALLHAFAPEQLEQRFARYRSAPVDESPPGDWTWQMYQHYYDELISSRQQGFDKLFWEVFDQAYDQALRAEAQ